MKSPLPGGCGTPTKAPTGVTGFDEITRGGLPRGRTTLVVGGPGSGKTILALHFLVHGARACAEPGIFVAFEEAADRIVSNAEGFGWDVGALRQKRVFFLDAQPMPDLIQSGDFDIGAMLAVLDAKIKGMKAKRIVFDALDVMLALLPDAAARTRELYRLHVWLVARGLTGVIAAKVDADTTTSKGEVPFRDLIFMVDCAVILNHSVVKGVSQRSLRIQKYRGSSFDENESPLVIGESGLDVAGARTRVKIDGKQLMERVSSGVERLDTMLGGGYYRGASVVISGVPGTAKTTLSGAFAEAACERGERTLFVSFDSDSSEVIRNLTSVGIRLDRHVKSGVLCITSARSLNGSAETYLVLIKSLVKKQRAVCVVIDPLSAVLMPAGKFAAHRLAERLIDWSKSAGITLVCTNLLYETSRQEGRGVRMQISTLADTWVHLNYLIQAGERNRGLSIIKSRGSAHSNQVRELILSDAGVTLTDTYTAGGDVLMGTQRWAKESADRVAKEVNEVAGNLKRVTLDAEEAEIEVRIKALQVELVAKQVEKALLTRTTKSHARESTRGRTRMGELRGADVASPTRK